MCMQCVTTSFCGIEWYTYDVDFASSYRIIASMLQNAKVIIFLLYEINCIHIIKQCCKDFMFNMELINGQTDR